jgi:mannose-6-phosphate isomerase-like protein (cupin superfamily)
MTDTLILPPNTRLTIIQERPERLVVEVHYERSDGRPPPHLHPDQDEHFEVLDGRLHALVDGDQRMLEAGETIDVPRGTTHQMWSPDGEVRARWETAPAGRTSEWFRHLDRIRRDGDWGAFGNLLREYDDVFRLVD